MTTVRTSLIGRVFDCAELPPVWARWLERTWLSIGPQAPACSYVLSLDVTSPLTAPGNTTPHTIYHFDQPVTVAVTADGWWWGDALRGVAAVVTSARLHVRVWGLEQATPDDDLAAVLSFALQEGLRTSGLLPLHGAAAIPPGQDRRASLFIGPSGRGKTTTLLRAMRAGWAPVCEDTVWLEPTTGQLYSGDRGLRLLPDAFDQLVPTAVTKPASTGSTTFVKTFVPFSDISTQLGVTWHASARLDRVVVLLRGGGGWQPLSRLEAVPHLWDATFLPLLPRTRQQTAAQIAQVVRQVRLARLAVDKPLDRLDLFTV